MMKVDIVVRRESYEELVREVDCPDCAARIDHRLSVFHWPDLRGPMTLVSVNPRSKQSRSEIRFRGDWVFIPDPDVEYDQNVHMRIMACDQKPKPVSELAQSEVRRSKYLAGRGMYVSRRLWDFLEANRLVLSNAVGGVGAVELRSVATGHRFKNTNDDAYGLTGFGHPGVTEVDGRNQLRFGHPRSSPVK